MQAQASTIEAPTSAITLRAGTPADAEQCGRIFFDAFESIASRHNLPVEPGSPEFTRFKSAQMLAGGGFSSILAEHEGEILGSAFLDERASVVGVGPVSVAPGAQDAGVGRLLMEAALRRERARGVAGIRLVQTTYHYRSLALYAKLGFVVREPLSVLQGAPARLSAVGIAVRAAGEQDIDACDELCRRVHGHDRHHELSDAVGAEAAMVAQRSGRISAYATGFGYGWHAVAETNEDLLALIGSAEAFIGLGIIVPSRNAELLRWCLEHGLRIVQQSTLMTIGLYNEPAGAYLPSILY
jgi:predicted N-acetyltransferase YhbS